MQSESKCPCVHTHRHFPRSRHNVHHPNASKRRLTTPEPVHRMKARVPPENPGPGESSLSTACPQDRFQASASCLPGQNYKAKIRTHSCRRLPLFSSKNRSHHRGSDHSNRSEHQQPALGHVRPHSAARRHGPLLHLQASIRSDQALCHGRQARLRRHHAFRPQGRQGRHVLVPVARDGHFGPGGHGQPRRRGYGHRHGRSGRHLLDVASRILRHGDDLL